MLQSVEGDSSVNEPFSNLDVKLVFPVPWSPNINNFLYETNSILVSIFIFI